jgi:formate hydrogenlyase subunit 6/NADH:ubiquinone oxidoreductase subunit I
MCPVSPKAVDWHDGDKKKPPSYKYERCIRCYCCQELCPEKAISLKVPFIRKIFGKKKKK